MNLINQQKLKTNSSNLKGVKEKIDLRTNHNKTFKTHKTAMKESSFLAFRIGNIFIRNIVKKS